MLIAKGVMTERGTTRRARIGFCKRCKTKVIQGLDADVCALDVDLDLELDESARVKYTLSTVGRKQIDIYRGGPIPSWRILLSEHRCRR